MADLELPRVNDETFDAFHLADRAVVFYKIAFCKGCEEYEPTIQKTVQSFNSGIKFGLGLMHIPGSRNIKKTYEFTNFPTTHFYRNGKLVFNETGPIPPQTLAEAIRKHLLA